MNLRHYFTYDDKYCISTNYTSKCYTTLWELSENGYKSIMELNYIISIEKETAQYWTDKLLRLMAFS